MASAPKRKIVSTCPVCSRDLAIARLACTKCSTTIDTSLAIPEFFRLPEDLQEFVMTFLRCRGSIRDMEKALGISYPTVCKRLDLVNALLGNMPVSGDRNDVLEQLERGDISAREAAQLLKGR